MQGLSGQPDASQASEGSDGDIASSMRPRGEFVWPPRKADVFEARGPDVTQRSFRLPGASEAAQQRLSWLSAIEQFWLPRTSLPLSERLEQAGVTRDDLAAFCHRCGKGVGPFDADDTGCAQCRGVLLAWERLIRLGPYSGVWKRAVRDVKFHQQAALGAAAGKMLAGQLQASGVLDLAPGHEVVVVPVPMNPWRRLARGVDHARIIAASVSRELKAPLWQPMAKRYRSEQAFLSATDRRSNVKGAMYLRAAGWWSRWRGIFGPKVQSADRGLTIILVDDVKTTGSTLREACRVLRLWQKEQARCAELRGKGLGGLKEAAGGVKDEKIERGLLIVGAVMAVSERGRV